MTSTPHTTPPSPQARPAAGRPSTRDTLRVVSDGPPVTVPPATVAAVVDDAVREALVDPSIRLVLPRRGDCDRVDECLPLGPELADVLTGYPAPTGHLHRVGGVVAGRPRVPLAAAARLVVASVARDLLDIRLARSDHDVANLRVALESSRIIGVAMGILMATRHCSAAEAFDALKAASQTQNRKLRDVAAEVEFTGTIAATAQHRQRA